MAEQQFYDTQPVEENHEVDYRDPTDVTEVEEEIKNGFVDPLSARFASWIRTKMYRRHVREALARMMEYTSVLFQNIKALAERTERRQTTLEEEQENLEERFKQQIEGNTDISEVIDARTSRFTGDAYRILGDRLDAIESQSYSIEEYEIDELVILEDNFFSANHEVVTVKQVADPDQPGALVIDSIDGKNSSFTLEKVGEING